MPAILPPFTIDARPLQPNSTIVGIRLHTTVVPERVGLHLAFVLDVSGSMEGDRLTALQRTLHLLIDDLQDSDCLTLVTYNSTGHLLCSACSDKALLRSLVESLRAEGGTNMGEGILTLSSASSVGAEPAAVFLLTDGHVNIGIRTAVGLRDLLQRALPPSIPVFTVGYGEDHDANILQALAVLRRGSYTCATSDEMIPAVVGDILGAVTTRVVKDVHVCAESGSADFLDMGAEKGSRDFFVGSLHTDKEQWVVLDANVEAQKTLCVRWSSGTNETVSVPVSVQTVAEYQTDIAQQWFRVRVVAALQEAQASLGSATHIGRLVSLETEMERSPVSRQPLILTLQARIKEMLEILEKPRHRHDGGFMLAGAGTRAADLTRLVSNITTLGTQRGILATHTLLADEATLFQSPHQRHASSQLVDRFSQATTE